MNQEGVLLNLEDNDWPLTTIDHDRMIDRATVVVDEDGFYWAKELLSGWMEGKQAKSCLLQRG